MIVLAIVVLVVMAGGSSAIGAATFAVDIKAWPVFLVGLAVSGLCIGTAVALALSPSWWHGTLEAVR